VLMAFSIPSLSDTRSQQNLLKGFVSCYLWWGGGGGGGEIGGTSTVQGLNTVNHSYIDLIVNIEINF
jgi:hypothetical protein